MPEAVLTTEDYESVHRAGRELRRQGWGQVFTLNQMFEAWAELVGSVEDGYDGNFVEEFHHDVSCRTWLAEAWPILTERIRSVRRAELADLDARFHAATVELAGSHPNADADSRWWLRRWPRAVISG